MCVCVCVCVYVCLSVSVFLSICPCVCQMALSVCVLFSDMLLVQLKHDKVDVSSSDCRTQVIQVIVKLSASRKKKKITKKFQVTI